MITKAAGLGTTPNYRKPDEQVTQEGTPTLRDSVLAQVAGGINDPAAMQPNTLPVNDRQWNLISRAAAESEDPDAYLARYGAALTFSKEYGIPVDAALDNLDELSSYLTGEPFKANKTGVQAIRDSFVAGRINMQYSDLAYKFKQADLKGEDTSAIMTQLEEYAGQIAALQDHQPRNIATTALKWTAEGALPYMIEVGKSSLMGATFAGGLATGFTAATGVTLGSLAAASPWSMAAIISMGATVGAVNRTRELMEGVAYLQLRELGVDKDIANVGSRTIGMVVGAIEAGLGIEVGTVIKAVGGEQAVTTAASKATAKLVTSGKLGAFIQGALALGVNATDEALEEMSEEVAEYLVRHIAYAWQETRGPVDPMPEENLVHDTLKAGFMGFGSALVLGGPSALMDAGISIRQQSAMRQDAKAIPSKEAFVNAMKDIRPDSIEAADWTDTMANLWEREHKGTVESSAIKSDQAAYNELDSGKGKIPTGTVRRLNSGRLYTAERENTTVDTSGAEHRRLLVGDPVSGACYGYIDYSVKGNDLVVNDVLVRSGYESVRKEAVLDLIEKYPGYEVTWEAKGDALADVRQQIIAANPRGQEGGLQYRDGIVDERLAIESQIERAMPNLSAPERSVAAILVQLRAESEGTSVQDWIDSHFRDGQIFGDSAEISEAMKGKRGAVYFDQDLKAIIYAGENADFSTFAHETFHVMLRNMDQIEQFRQAVTEAAATPEFMTWLADHSQIFADGYFAGMDAQQLADIAAAFAEGEWGRTQEEFSARLYEGYLADGKTASTRLQQLFQQIAQWMRKVYDSLKHSVDLDPRIVEVFDSLSDKQSPLAKHLVTQESNNGQMKSEALYQDDDGFMKAPNGKPTKLTERQWMQVRTPEFIKWFGDWMNDPENASKVVDENGEPKVVHHYTSEKFNTFDVSKARQNMDIPGFYFSDEKNNWKDMGNNLISAFLNIRNPIDNKPMAKGQGSMVRDNLISEGYDGAITVDEDMEETEYLAFFPTQIKSATDNIGTFDGENPNILFQEDKDILFQEAPPTESKAFKDWFGNSKVVDENGQPLVLYHGTDAEFDSFSPKDGKNRVSNMQLDFGSHFTISREYAQAYSRKGNVIPVYLSMNNPLDLVDAYFAYKGDPLFDALFDLYNDLGQKPYPDMYRDRDGNKHDDVQAVFMNAHILNAMPPARALAAIKDAGFDGVKYQPYQRQGLDRYTKDPVSYIAIFPTQVKSVHNRGTWDATNPNMLFQDGLPITEAVLDDARGMESWEEFMSFYQAFSFGEEVPTDEAWYKQVFNEANGIVVADEVAQERVEAAHRQLQDEDAKDQYMRDQLSTDEGVVDFLGKLGYMLSPRTLYDTEGDPVFRETVEELQREAESLVHPTVLANAYRVKGGSQPTQRAIKSVRTLMTGDAVRYYRDIYALVMEDLELRPQVIDSRLPAISDPGINTLDNLSITERLKLANRIEATELKKALLSGEEKLDGAAEKIIRDLDLQIQELNKKISEHETTIDESTKKFNETERSLLWAYRDQREAKKQLDEQISKVRKLTDQGRRISKEELKRTHDLQDKLKLLDNQIMAMRESMKEKSKAQHQAAMDALRQKFKEKSAEQRAAANTKRQDAVSEARRKATEKARLAREAATLKRQEAVAEQRRKSSERAAEARLQATVKRHEALDKLKGQLTEKQRQKAEAQRVRKYKLDVARRIMAKPSDAINYEQAVMIYELQAALDPAFRRESTLVDGADGQRRVSIDDARELFSGSSREEIIEAIGLRMYEWIADERRPLNDWTVAELEDLAERVGNLRAEGRRILASKRERQQSIARQYQESIMRSLIATGKYQDRPIVGSLDDQKEKTSPFRTVKAFRYSTLPMRAKAMMLDNDTQGTAYNLLVTRKRDAQAVEWTAVELRQKPVIDLMKQVGLTEQDLYKTVGVSLDTNTSTRFTYSALMYIWLSQFDVDNRNAVAYGNLVTQSEKANLHEDNGMIMALGDERYRNLLQQAEYHLNQDDGRYMQVLERVREDFNGQRDRINEVAIREFNKPLRKVDEYLPIHRREFNGENMHEQIADDWFNQNAGGSPTGVTKGFTRDRIKISPNHQRPVNLDLMQVWNRSVRDQEHFIAFAEYGRELNRVFKSQGSVNLRNIISRTLGQEMVSDIHAYMNQVINPQRNIDLAGAQKAIRFMRGNLGAAYLTWKMSALVLQTITSPAPFLQEVRPLYMAKGYIELFSHPLEAIAWINEKSPMMKNRTMNVIIDEILQQSRTYQQNKAMHGVRKMQEIGGMGLTLVDRYAVAGGWLGAYHQRMDALMEQGMTSEQAERMAVAWADDITLKTQPTGDITEIAPLFTSGGEWARAFMQFTTSLNVIWTNLTYDMPTSARAAMNKSAPADARRAQFSRVVGTIVGYGLAGAVLGAVADGYDDDDDEIDKLRKWIYWSTTQASESVPLFGQHVDSIVRTLVTGEKPDFFSDEFFPGMMKIFKGMGNLAQGDLVKALNNLGQGAGYMGGVPVSGIKQAIKTVKEGPGAMLGR